MSIDFKSLADDLLGRSKSLLESWFPAGKYRGHEYVLGDLSGSAGDSLSINTRTGLWKDFASGETGGDLISLYAAAHGMSQLEAAKELGAEDDGDRKPRQKVPAKPREPEPPKRPTLPAVGTHDCHHKVFGKPSAVWEYLDQAGALLGYVARYNPPGERKQIVPWTYAADGWGMGQWNDPRPMYGLQFLTMYPNRPVLLVEGEKAADAARQFAGHVYVVMTWPGGAQAWKKVDWSAIAGRKVLMWPDADDPGTKAMHDIAQHIRGAAPEIKIIDIDGLADGFDAADALADGMDWAGFKAFATPRVTVFHTAPADPPPDNEPPPPPPPPEGSKPAPDKPKRQKPTLTVVEGSLARKPEPQLDPGYWQTKPWAEHILITDKGSAKPCFANAVAALRHDRDWAGVIGYDLFGLRSVVLKDNVFGLKAGQWIDAYDFIVCEWIQRLGIGITTQTATAAVEAVAHENAFHPLQDYLNGLEWDGIERINHWLSDLCGADVNDYTRAVGAKWLIGAVARALNPGCKMDTALVFEGRQGAGKSTVFAILGGDWFTDDVPEMHGKTAAEAVGGAWIVEIAELAAMNRSEVENVKAFITRRVDRFRPAYGRRVIESPRTSVFGGTSNGHAYLKDDENRRFWPVEVRDIDFDAIKTARDQLWAEAVHEYRNGGKWYLEGEITNEARVQQESRRQVDVWEDIVAQYIVESPHHDYNDTSKLYWHRRAEPLVKITMAEVFENALNIPVGRWTRSDQMRLAGCFKSLSWVRKKQNDGTWAYVKPRQTEQYILDSVQKDGN
jgi:putative DNA primase/helicase